MLYTQTLTVPAGTQSSTPATVDVVLSAGVIKHVWFHFPPGCRGVVDVALFDQLVQVAPATPGVALALDDALFGFPMNYDVMSTPHTLQLYGWSPESSFPHTITLYVDVDVSVPEALALTPSELFGMIQGL